MWPKTYSTYILTNADRTVLYTGVTNNLRRRLLEHWVGKKGSFTTTYHVYYLLWHEDTRYILNAIALEKEIKLLIRQKKEQLITATNPDWEFRNAGLIGYWPPTEEDIMAIEAYRKDNPEDDPWV